MDIEKLIERLEAWNEQHLSVVCGNGHFACDYLCENEDCIVVRAATALSTLQAENEKLRVEAEGMRSNWYKSVEEIKKLRAELERVKKRIEIVEFQRDAAIKQLHGHCPACTHYTPNYNEGPCAGCKHEYYQYQNIDARDNWQWRGPQKED